MIPLGLDSYLYRTHYIADRPWSTPPVTEGTDAIEAIALVPGLSLAIPPERLAQVGGVTLHVEIQIGYWRKANAVHAWFVTFCGEGVDECQSMYVSRERLGELRDACAEVLAAKGTPEEAETIQDTLPPQSGFFFGTTDVDEYYWDQARRTHDLISWLLKHDTPDAEYEYRASW